MRIEYLADYTEHIPTLAKWFHDEWGYLAPGRSLAEQMERVRMKANRGTMPMAFIALDGDTPIGSASLVECDMHSRSHLKPWLSSVFVAPSYRRRGVGTALVSRVVRAAKEQGFPLLYLWTPNEERFYAKRGWEVIERTEYKKENAVVMRYPADSGKTLGSGYGRGAASTQSVCSE